MRCAGIPAARSSRAARAASTCMWSAPRVRRADARELYELLKRQLPTAREGLWHLSALMCPQHRSDTISEIKQALVDRRNAIARGDAPKPVRVVSTNLIEAGVDRSAFPGLVRDHVMVAALLPAGRAALAVLRERLELGFRVAKWKVGVGSIADELSLLDDLLALLPAGARLRLDANGAWDRRQAERWLEAAAERPIEYVEQPVEAQRRGAEDLLLGLAADYPVPLALDESIAEDADIEAWLGRGWSGVYVVKPTLLLNPPRVMDRLAKAGASVVFSSAMETTVGFKQGLRWAFAWPGEARAVGFGVGSRFAGPAGAVPPLAPFWRWADVERMSPEATWNALN